MNKILHGKVVAEFLSQVTSRLLTTLIDKPSMVIIHFANDPSADYYFKNIVKQGNKLGLNIFMHELSVGSTTNDVSDVVINYNNNANYHGILIQKPLPENIDDVVVSNSINPDKDIDGIHPINLGKIFLSQECMIPCTAAAVLELIKFYKIQTTGKKVVILGRSSVVAKPLAGLLLQKSDFGNATVTICHSHTPEIHEMTASADILISAIGKPLFVKPNMIKNDVVCIDVGINSVKDDLNLKGEVFVGDIDFVSCLDKVKSITPVPGGIGTITTSLLLQNLIRAAKNQSAREK